MSDEHDGNEGGAVGGAADGAAAAAEGVEHAAEGDAGEAIGGVAGGLGKVAGGIASILPEDGDAGKAREALTTASNVAQGVSSGVEAARGLSEVASSGNLGQGLGALGSATEAARYIVPDERAREVLEGAGQVARGAQNLTQSLQNIGGGARPGESSMGGGRNDDVAFHLEVDGIDATWGVESIQLQEGLNRLSMGVIDALCEHAQPEVSELLDKDCHLTIERESQQRSYHGVVWHAEVRETVHGVEVRLHVVPAARYLSEIFTSRIYQDKTVPEIVEEIYGEKLGGRHRSLQNDLTESYETREYTVQYQESCFNFIARLLEEEGIFFYFDHTDDLEKLVLVDGTSGLPTVRDDGSVPYAEDPYQVSDHEAVRVVTHEQHVGATDVVTSDYDWTNPALQVRGEQTGRGSESLRSRSTTTPMP